LGIEIPGQLDLNAAFQVPTRIRKMDRHGCTAADSVIASNTGD